MLGSFNCDKVEAIKDFVVLSDYEGSPIQLNPLTKESTEVDSAKVRKNKGSTSRSPCQLLLDD